MHRLGSQINGYTDNFLLSKRGSQMYIAVKKNSYGLSGVLSIENFFLKTEKYL